MKFGFELEFGTNAAEVVAYLNRKNRHMMPMAEMHRYHCDCGYCSIPGSVLRAQTDSSCAGEIITTPFDNWENAREVMAEIEEAAIEADGEPGIQAGLHVHVSLEESNPVHLIDSFIQFMRWEQVLVGVAAGRFEANRNANRHVAQDMRYLLESEFQRKYAGLSVPRGSVALINKVLARSDLYEKERIYTTHRENDRHSNLNVRTRFQTWEFRLWNSTRVAWRMELWCRLSVALIDPVVTERLAAMEQPDLAGFRTVISDWDRGTGQLLDRQVTYSNKVVNGAINVGEFSLL